MNNLSLSVITNQLEKWIGNNNRLKLGEAKAAVLVPFIEKKGTTHVVLTQRSNELRTHSGQISFPGGKVDDDDEDIYVTALRETNEELGISPNEVKILGLFDDFFTPYYKSITPVLATLEPKKYLISEAEIDKVLEVPLNDLLNPEIYHSEIWVKDGIEYEVHFYNWVDPKNGELFEIWGATAGVLRKLIKIINSQ